MKFIKLFEEFKRGLSKDEVIDFLLSIGYDSTGRVATNEDPTNNSVYIEYFNDQGEVVYLGNAFLEVDGLSSYHYTAPHATLHTLKRYLLFGEEQD